MPATLDERTPVTFVVAGHRLDGGSKRGGAAAPASPAMGLPGTVKASVRVGATRGTGDLLRIEAVPGTDMVVLHIENGPTLVLHPHTARDLMLAQTGIPRRSTRAAGGKVLPEAGPSEVNVPAQLRWEGLESHAVSSRGASRGFLGDVLLSAIEVVTGPLREHAQDFAADQIVQRIDGQVVEGVYALNAQTLTRLKGVTPVDAMAAAADGGPTLVFVHGTFSETSSGFGKLWQQHPQRVRTLFSHYSDRVYALDHATLGKSPIENAYTLALACPPGARLHLVTHSRGGLVAEVLARAAGLKQLDDAASELFMVGELPDDMIEGLGAAARQKLQRALDEQKRVLGLLIAHLQNHRISIDRIVRAACPARGTLLASGRFDAYISIFKWALDLAQIPVLPELVDFIGGVAQRRADPTQLPGVAAMIPDSPLVRWLHAADEPVPGQLRVVAGDLEGDSIGSWLKTLMADAFYWTDNDLVVQTRSMYGGVPRADGASFMLDQGGQVTHFNYFANERTAEAVVNGLTQEAPTGWRAIGPLSSAGESAGGVRGAAKRGGDQGDATTASGATSEKPAVFVLPGILGSHIKVDGKRIWLGWRLINGLKKLAYPDPAGRSVEPDGPVGSSYDDLVTFLSRTHEVIEFSYDWRKPIELEAQRLGRAVEAAMAAREKSGQPVRMVAHSMGGLVARTMQLECPATWAQMMARPGARLLMLGTPNGGSWAPMQVLSGDDTFGNALVAFGAPFQDHSTRQLMAQFPGFIQLQMALLDDPRRLDRSETWQKLADNDLAEVRAHDWWHDDGRQINAYRWGVPEQGILDQAIALRRRLDEQRDQVLSQFKDQLVLVVGGAAFTPDGYEIGDAGLVYLNAPDAGDGRVPLASAMLPGVPAWKVDCEHGALPAERRAYDAYLDLLVEGSTRRLPVQAEIGSTRGAVLAPAPVRSRPARLGNSPRPPLDADLTPTLDIEPDTGSAGRGKPSVALNITVVNGDLKFVRHPLMLGHYNSSHLTGTEAVVDRLIGGTMSESLALRQYPDLPGTHQFFANSGAHNGNPLQLPRPECVVVTGLGGEGNLRPSELAYTVQMGALALAQRIFEQPSDGITTCELAATLIGSGGAGISAGQAAQAIVQGVRDADVALGELNARLDARSGADRRRWPRIGHVHLIELYLDRASEAWRALYAQAQASPGRYRLSDTIQSGIGAMRRPLEGGYRGTGNDYIRATVALRPTGEAVIEYTVDTKKRARTERLEQPVQERLLRDLVAQASSDSNQDARIGRTLFNLLVPLELEPFLGGTTEMLLQVDRATSGIPWELLDTDTDAQGPGARPRESSIPWAIRAKLIRTLTTVAYRRGVVDARPDAHMLVIGEPQCDAAKYPPLPGARAEARAVHDLLLKQGGVLDGQVVGLFGADADSPGPGARTIINELMSRNWRIVHIAGHGEAPEDVDADSWDAEANSTSEAARSRLKNARGVVLSKGTFLGPCEIRSMRIVPELVFVNCCHLAARSPGQVMDVESHFDRARFASGVAEALIEIGVRCVVAAGWAVEDEPALKFATGFYGALLRGARFIDAVAQARLAAYAPDSNTWAAYQCYGDPDWQLKSADGAPQRPAPSLADEYAGVMSAPALALALETLAIESEHQGRNSEIQRARIRHLEAEFAPRWGGIGAVAEAFGVAWNAAGDADSAIAWYERALAANDSSASIKASEQWGNLRVQQAWRHVDPAVTAWHRFRKVKGQGAAEKAARAHLANIIPTARTEIGCALQLLNQLVSLQPTMERHSLCGSAYKRLAMIERASGDAAIDRAAEQQALRLMLASYSEAERLGRDAGLLDWYYPALNRLAAEVALGSLHTKGQPAGRTRSAPLDADRLASVRQALVVKTRDDPDFWSVVGLTGLRMYEAIAQGSLAEQRAAIERDYDVLQVRMPSIPKWKSILDQLDFVLEGALSSGVATEREAALGLISHVQAYIDAGA
ncbi:MAG: CHAT domain-containing protein [Burkholderiaceae bacterium]|nr:CHAT domain-containing protein [Burkholderiaceae bacterium]